MLPHQKLEHIQALQQRREFVGMTGDGLCTSIGRADVVYRESIILIPAAGAILMTVSMVVVAINAGLLKLRST